MPLAAARVIASDAQCFDTSAKDSCGGAVVDGFAGFAGNGLLGSVTGFGKGAGVGAGAELLLDEVSPKTNC